MFKQLSESEVEEYKQWARDNFVPGKECNPVFHPVIQEEWARLQVECGKLKIEYCE